MWAPAARELADDNARLRALTEVEQPAGVGLACQRFRQQAIEARGPRGSDHPRKHGGPAKGIASSGLPPSWHECRAVRARAARSSLWLSAHVRGTTDLIRRYDGKLLLVFDWGAGTLDLTLCRVLDGLLVQVANDGTDEVGGDVFDDELRNEVEKRSRAAHGLGEDVEVLPEARKRLLHQCEKAKIRLSDRNTWNVYVDPYYQSEDQTELQVNLSRDDLQDIVGHLVRKGVARIERLLEREGYSTASVELCLATGGIVNMPLVKNRLDELFGPGRVHVSRRNASAIAEGAAWVAHDEARLHLAKNVELVLARNSYMPLLPAGLEMPQEREHRRERFSMYCVDPSHGYGKFSLVSPHRPGPRVLPDDKRRPLCNMLLKVDAEAKPFRERLELEASINEDLVLTVTAWSLNQKGREEAEVHDLEFALATPGAKSGWLRAGLLEGENGEGTTNEPGDLVMRSNLASQEDLSLVPGEVMEKVETATLQTALLHPSACAPWGADVVADRNLTHPVGQI